MSTANPFGPRRSHPARRNALFLALLATVSLSACGGDDEDGNQPAGAPETSTPSPTPATDDQQTRPADGTPIRITFGDTELTARLHNNATARDLAFYYDSDAPFFNGIVRIGEFDGNMDAIQRQSQDFTVTIERG